MKTRTFLGYTLGANVSLVQKDSGFVGGKYYSLRLEGLYADSRGRSDNPDLQLGTHELQLSESQFQELSKLLASGSPDVRPHVSGRLEIVSNSD